MNYNAKHACNNHPKVLNKEKATLILASTLLVSALSAHALTKNDKDIVFPQNNFNNKQIESTISVNNVNDLINHLKIKYQTIDDYGFTFEGLVINYFENALASVPEEEQSKVLNNILEDKDLINNIYNYAKKNSPIYLNVVENIENKEINENIKAIMTNSDLMETIRKYSKMYGENTSKVVILLAMNMKDGQINKDNPLGISDEWRSLNSSRTVYNYELNENQSLNEYSKYTGSLKNNLRYNIMVCQNSVKEADGSAVGSFKYIKYGPEAKTINDNESLEEYRALVLSYLAKYNKTLVTNYTLHENDTKVYAQRLLTEDDVSNIINQIITEMSANLTNTYNKNM